MNGVDAWVRHAYSTTLHCGPPETVDCASFSCDVTLKAQYEAVSEEEKQKFGYERLLYECLASLVRQCNKRVANNQEKISKAACDEIPEETMKRLTELESNYKAKIDQSERLGETGEIEESMRLVADAEVIKAEKASVEASLMTNEHGKRFIVCQTTGDLIESAAAADDAWMASHFESEDYQGWKTLRDWHTRLGAMRDGRGPPRGIPDYKGEGDVGTTKDRKGRSDDRSRSDRRRRRDDDDVYRYRDDDDGDQRPRTYTSRRRDECESRQHA